MPYQTTIESAGIVWRHFGRVDHQEFLAANQDVWGREDWRRFRYQLVDLLDIAELDMNEQDAAAIAALDNVVGVSGEGMRIALVAQEPAHVKLCLAYASELSAKDWIVRLFTDRTAAMHWCREAA